MKIPLFLLAVLVLFAVLWLPAFFILLGWLVLDALILFVEFCGGLRRGWNGTAEQMFDDDNFPN